MERKQAFGLNKYESMGVGVILGVDIEVILGVEMEVKTGLSIIAGLNFGEGKMAGVGRLYAANCGMVISTLLNLSGLLGLS